MPRGGGGVGGEGGICFEDVPFVEIVYLHLLACQVRAAIGNQVFDAVTSV